MCVCVCVWLCGFGGFCGFFLELLYLAALHKLPSLKTVLHYASFDLLSAERGDACFSLSCAFLLLPLFNLDVLQEQNELYRLVISTQGRQTVGLGQAGLCF